MITEDSPTPPDIDESLTKLHLSPPAPIQEAEPNPWRDSARNTPSPSGEHGRVGRVEIPNLAAIDPAVAGGFAAEAGSEPQPPAVPAKQEILEEFDPLAVQEEKAAKEAWENAESHPPPPPPPPVHNTEDSHDRPPPVPAKNGIVEPARSASPLPSFPSLVALARTFALPSLSSARQRPKSLDTAASVPSPATLSSFASQQHVPRRSATPVESRSSTPTTRTKSNDSDPPQFDFQKFLDQMKTKGAEPVARYLRSYDLMNSLYCDLNS